MYQLAIPSHGATMFGVYYRAAGITPHPTVLLLHGLPGFEQNIDLAQAIRRTGWNVLIFHYRGSWGSGGTFSFSHCIEDVHATLDYLRTPENAGRLGIDPQRLVLIGHSMGGFLAGFSAAQDSAVLGAAMLAFWNPGTLGPHASPQLNQAMLEEFRSDVGPLTGTSAEALLEEAKENAAAWDLVRRAPLWNSRPLLIVEADDFLRDDDAAVAAALRQVRAHMTEIHLPTDHSFSDHRIALQIAVLAWLQQFK
jgi:acetyl esterase/lipase